MRTKKVWIPVGLSATALLLWAFVRHDGAASTSYRFVAVEAGSVESVVTSTGTLQATETVEVGTQVSGQIAELFVDFNDRVSKGQLLARIDATILQQEVRAAEASIARNRAELLQADRQLTRNRDLHGQKVLTDAELEQSEYAFTIAKAAMTSAEVALERAKRNLAYTEIRAPIDGVVVERSVDVGQTVAASMSAPVLFVIAQDLAEMEILASVDESDIGRISQGQEARFTVQAYGDAKFAGAVEQVRLQSTMQENVVSYAVVVRVDNESGRLLPGMTATVEFVTARAEDVLKVANTALRLQPTEAMRAELGARRGGAPGRETATATATSTATGGAAEGSSTSSRAGRGSVAGAADDAAEQRTGGGERASRVMLWYVDADGAVNAVRVETGLTDGQYTEVRGEGLDAGLQVIAGVTSGDAGAAAAPNPFQSAQPQRGGPPGRF
jgi:HlyD family secretion protein